MPTQAWSWVPTEALPIPPGAVAEQRHTSRDTSTSLHSHRVTAACLEHHPPPPQPHSLSYCRALFLKLAELGDPESTPLWGGMRDELDTALRLCDHELRKKAGGAADAGAVADLARLGSDGTWGSFTGPTGADTAGGLLQV